MTLFGPLTVTLFNVTFAPFKFRDGRFYTISFSYIFPPSPRVHIMEVVGSVNGVSGDELALAVLANIKGRFSARGLSWSSIYVLKRWRSSSEGWFAQQRHIGMKGFSEIGTCIPRAKVFLRTSSNVIVFVLAP